jgi:hypothetical protein
MSAIILATTAHGQWISPSEPKNAYKPGELQNSSHAAELLNDKGQ